MKSTPPAGARVNIQGCKAVTRKGMRHLRRCEQLLSLNLRGLPRLTGASMDQLHGMQLKELLLGGSSWAVTDEDVARLVVACPSLTQLDIRYLRKITPRLVNLLLEELSGSRVVTLIIKRTWGEQKNNLPPLPSSAPLRLVFV